MKAGPKYIRHPALPFSIVKLEEETGFVYITAGGVTDVRRAARIHVTALLERQDFLARLPADQVERVRVLATKLATSAPSPKPQPSIGTAVFVSELMSCDGEYCTVYTGTMGALVGAGIATAEQFPTGINGDKTWTKSGGYKGSGKNPTQRWKVRRLRRSGDLFEVHRYHAPRRVGPAFERFMARAMQPVQ